MEDNPQIFRINLFLMVKNIAFAILLVISVFMFLSKGNMALAFKILLITVGLYYLFVIASESLTSITAFIKSGETSFQFSRFIFYKSNLVLEANEFYYSYKMETGARGGKHTVFTIYDIDKDKIIKITPGSSGWSVDKIRTIIDLWQKMGVKEIS